MHTNLADIAADFHRSNVESRAGRICERGHQMGKYQLRKMNISFVNFDR